MDETDVKALAMRLAVMEAMIAMLFAKEAARSGQPLSVMHAALVKNAETGARALGGQEDLTENAARIVDGVFGLASLYLANEPQRNDPH